MIRSSENTNVLKKKSDTLKNQDRLDNMFHTDNTNSIRQQKLRFNEYEDIFQGNHSNLVQEHISMEGKHNKYFSSDNTNLINERVQRNKMNRGLLKIDNSIRGHYKLYENDSFSGNTVKKMISENTLSKLYFSKENVKILHNTIRHTVWIHSNKKHIISKQSETELEIIMRSIFLQYSKNQNCNIKKQIDELNNYVIEYAVNNILVEIDLYLGYINKINSLPVPMEHSKNLSIKGNNTLEPNHFF